MNIEDVKSILLNLKGAREFNVIGGPIPGMLGGLVFDTPMPWIIDMSKIVVPFRIGIESEKGNIAIFYCMTIENYEVRTWPVKIDGDNLTCRGKIVMPEDESSEIQKEKYDLIPVGTEMEITYNDKTGTGKLKIV